MKIKHPKRYAVEGNGNWGISEGLIYENWEEREFDWREVVRERPGIKSVFGLDFGYTADPTAFGAFLVDEKAREIFIFDEFYARGLLNNQIADMIKNKGFAKERIIADSAEQKSIEEIKRAGIPRIKPAAKGRDSINAGIQKIKEYKIYVHPKCTNAILELSNYVWDKSRDGKQLNKPIDDFNHFLDAFRYAMEQIGKKKELKAMSRPF